MAQARTRRTRPFRTRAQAAALTVGAFLAAMAYLLGAYVIVFQARIGPVVSAFDPEHGHGVHAGDMLALPLLALAAVMFVTGVYACDDAVRPRARTPWRVAMA